MSEEGSLGDGLPITINGSLRAAILPVLSGGDVNGFATGRAHGLMIRGGAVYSWGYNTYGQLGDGTHDDRSTPMLVPGFESGATLVAAGAYHSMAVKDGTLYVFGSSRGPNAGTALSPQAVPGLTGNITVMAGGISHSLVVMDGTLYAWGANFDGALGDGTSDSRLLPASVPGFESGVTAVAAAGGHSLAVRNGALFAWGDNSLGTLGDGTTQTRYSPVSVVGMNSGVTAVATSINHSLAVRDGQVYVWGWPNYGRLGLGQSYMPTQRTPVPIPGLSNIVAIAANYGSSYALTEDGMLWGWGDDHQEQLAGTVSPPGNIAWTPVLISAPAHMRFTGISAGDQGAFALATVAPLCSADFGTVGGLHGSDGVLDNNDFIAFIDEFFTADPSADIGSTGGTPGVDGRFDNNDFIVYIDRFFAGC